MKSILTTLITMLFFTFATATAMQNESSTQSHSDVVAENLITAVNNIDIISLNVLLAEGAAVDTVDEAGNSPLMLAVKIGNPRMVKIILAHNPDVNRRNHDGNTALMIASANGILPIVTELKKSGADEKLRNHAGYNSAEIALRNGHGSIAQFLNGFDTVTLSR